MYELLHRFFKNLILILYILQLWINNRAVQSGLRFYNTYVFLLH